MNIKNTNKKTKSNGLVESLKQWWAVRDSNPRPTD